jgi:3'-phosphoadenosine 5'-phosphosulfate sulfotransferase (PAPS reductase)/FAD synthetase
VTVNALLNPSLDVPASPEDVATLTGPQRQERVTALIFQAEDIIRLALEEHLDGKELVGRVVLYSGGNDSTVLVHLMRNLGIATHAAHANTTIGIEATRQFVRDTCAMWRLPLIEKLPKTTYRELVIAYGFPGPGHHYKMFQQLKERCLRQVRKDLVVHTRRQRVLFIAGRRRTESARRAGFRASGKAQVPLWEREDNIIWASPLANWTKLDLNTYRLMHGNVPVNEVTEKLHMSGECLCGAFAHEGELEEIRDWFPEEAAKIDALMAEVKEAGWEEPHCIWGHRQKGGSANRKVGKLCTSCEFEG